jgi:hypothetical protein
MRGGVMRMLFVQLRIALPHSLFHHCHCHSHRQHYRRKASSLLGRFVNWKGAGYRPLVGLRLAGVRAVISSGVRARL